MRCPVCQSENTKVIDTREAEEGTVIRRRRECLDCQFRFSTYEQLEILNLDVVKKDKTRESYQREKLLQGIRRACEKRPITQADFERFLVEVEQEILRAASSTKKNGKKTDDSLEIASKQIGEIVVNKLKELDQVAYVRFASVYRSFDDVESFVEEISDLDESNK